MIVDFRMKQEIHKFQVFFVFPIIVNLIYLENYKIEISYIKFSLIS